jgi:hypothetical protein
MKTPFDEKTMRKFNKVNDALKTYIQEKIPQKRIVWLFQEANEIRFANISVNASHLQQLSKSEAQKFIDKLCGKNKTKVQAFDKANAIWKVKFSDVKEPIADSPVRIPIEEIISAPKSATESSIETSPETESETDSNV